MKLGIIGTGYIAGVVLPVLKNLKIDVRAIAATPRSEEKMRSLLAEYGIPRGFTSTEEMLDAEDAGGALVDTVYIAAPNSLHYQLAKEALLAGRHVIVEKPFASNLKEAEALAALSIRQNRMIMEAISTLYLPDYQKVKELLPEIGDVRIVSCNFSQYSSRYDAFLKGDVKPAFDPAKSGGALMDLGVYNIHYIVGLFGRPAAVHYTANMAGGIDTSGILTLGYDGFSAVSIAAKDCKAPCFSQIQGTKGMIVQHSAANSCEGVTLTGNSGESVSFREEVPHRLAPEFERFRKMIDEGDTDAYPANLRHSLIVMSVLDEARKSAGIRFPADDLK